jgi:hypothetical protein
MKRLKGFVESVAERFSPNGFHRDLIFSFFCTCAELAVVSRQKDKENKTRFLSDNIDFFYFFQELKK